MTANTRAAFVAVYLMLKVFRRVEHDFPITRDAGQAQA